MNNIYTYEVDHGDESPSIGAGTEVNGGKVLAFSFTGQLGNNNKAYEILDSIFDENEVGDDVREKLLEIQALI